MTKGEKKKRDRAKKREKIKKAKILEALKQEALKQEAEKKLLKHQVSDETEDLYERVTAGETSEMFQAN